MTLYRVQLTVGTCTYNVVVRARYHDEAYRQALMTVPTLRVERAVVTPMRDEKGE